MLERSSYGVEFFDMGHEARAAPGAHPRHAWRRALRRIRATDEQAGAHGQLPFAVERFAASYDDDATLAKVNSVLNYITDNYREPISAEMLAEQVGMSLSKFSRFFRKATGNSFTDFISRLRINKACQLLMDTDQYVCERLLRRGFLRTWPTSTAASCR